MPVFDEDPAVVARLVIVGLEARGQAGGVFVELFDPDVFARAVGFIGFGRHERQGGFGRVALLDLHALGRLHPPVGHVPEGEDEQGGDDQDQRSQAITFFLPRNGTRLIPFHVQHFEHDQVLHVDQTHGAIVWIHNRQFIDAILLHDRHGLARQGVGADALGIAGHDVIDAGHSPRVPHQGLRVTV